MEPTNYITLTDSNGQFWEFWVENEEMGNLLIAMMNAASVRMVKKAQEV